MLIKSNQRHHKNRVKELGPGLQLPFSLRKQVHAIAAPVKVSFVVECRDRTEFTLVLPGISFAGVGVKKEDMLQRDEKYTVALDFKVPDVSEEIFSEEFGVEHGEFYVAKLTGVVLFQVAECIVAPNIDSMRAVVSQ